LFSSSQETRCISQKSRVCRHDGGGSFSLLSLLGLDLLHVKFELLAFQDVTVSTTALSGATGDGGQDTTGHELLLNGLLDLKFKRSKNETSEKLTRISYTGV